MEREIKNKRALKKIAKEWAAAILVNCETDSFDEDMSLTEEQEGYIVEQVKEIGLKLMKSIDGDCPESDLRVIVDRRLNPQNDSKRAQKTNDQPTSQWNIRSYR